MPRGKAGGCGGGDGGRRIGRCARPGGMVPAVAPLLLLLLFLLASPVPLGLAPASCLRNCARAAARDGGAAKTGRCGFCWRGGSTPLPLVPSLPAACGTSLRLPACRRPSPASSLCAGNAGLRPSAPPAPTLCSRHWRAASSCIEDVHGSGALPTQLPPPPLPPGRRLAAVGVLASPTAIQSRLNWQHGGIQSAHMVLDVGSRQMAARRAYQGPCCRCGGACSSPLGVPIKETGPTKLIPLPRELRKQRLQRRARPSGESPS